jgi:recombinational DNA repair protein RecT
MENYTAITKQGFSIITVLAKDMDDARAKIKIELHKNPSRQAYYGPWKKACRPVAHNNIINYTSKAI